VQTGEVERIPSSLQPSRFETRLISHRKQERADRFPGRHRLSRLDPAHRRLRRARPPRKRALAETEPNAQIMYESSGIADI
jgi:hypothetical protein